MPAALVKSFAKKTGKTVAAVEKIWDEIKAGMKDSYPDVKESNPRYYQIVTGILKKRLKLENVEESTLSTNIAVKPERMGMEKRKLPKIEPDSYMSGVPVFEVDFKDFMVASKTRASGSRYRITNEKFRQFIKENGYRCSAAVQWNGHIVRVK